MRLGASRPALSPPFRELFLTFVSRRSSVFLHLLSFSVQVYAKKEIMNKVIAKATKGLSAKDLKIAKHLIARAQVCVCATFNVCGMCVYEVGGMCVCDMTSNDFQFY